jgi:hypothetical protein
VSELDRRFAEMERSLEPQRQRSIARGPIGLIAVLLLLSLAVGVVAAIDIRRLQTPRGTALAWTGAAVFGDCTAYDRLSIGAADGSASKRCAVLRQRTQQARDTAAQIGIDVLSVQQRGRAASVEVEVRRPSGRRSAVLPLRRKGDGWAVVLDDRVCRLVGGCP